MAAPAPSPSPAPANAATGTNISLVSELPDSSPPKPEDKIAVDPSLAPKNTRTASDPRLEEYTSLPEVVVPSPPPPPPPSHQHNSSISHNRPVSMQSTTMTNTNVPTVSSPSPSYAATPPPPFDKVVHSGYSNVHQSMDMAPQPAHMAPPDGQTVTPLHLLGTQADTIDCPFCQRRSMTTVSKKPSALTHTFAVGLFLVSFCGALAPYMCNWCTHTYQYCQNCGRKVTFRSYGSKTNNVYGTPEHLREVSRFPAAQPRPMEMEMQ